jgi:hypothetical protein
MVIIVTFIKSVSKKMMGQSMRLVTGGMYKVLKIKKILHTASYL